MGDYEESFRGLEGESDHFPPPPPRHPGGRERMNIQKSSVCSRAYFVVVMAFFHIYIINIIALLLYVHYNTGSGEQDVPLEKSVPRPMPTEHQTPSPNLSPELSFHLPRLEGIRVHALIIHYAIWYMFLSCCAFPKDDFIYNFFFSSSFFRIICLRFWDNIQFFCLLQISALWNIYNLALSCVNQCQVQSTPLSVYCYTKNTWKF